MLAYPHRLESGPWLAAGSPLDGATVHERLVATRAAAASQFFPYSVYVHVPFCASICSFCALYTRTVSSDADAALDEYLECVTRSLAEHPWAGIGTTPTTVHFGGGTPLFLGLPRFAALASAVRNAFGTSAGCEWAIETTTSSLEPATLACLHDLGFRRIHLGIQTLDDATRQRVGRHETGVRAVERVREIQDLGFFASVDLIIGFDGVGVDIVQDDLRRLYDAGVRMFSICELRERGVARLGISNASDKLHGTYGIWQAIWEFMADVALAPIHLGQFARGQADNLYFTHPARGESCVAVGPYAHGSVGDLSFGNQLMPDYYDAVRAGRPPIQWGVEYAPSARTIRALEQQLLGHQVSIATLNEVLSRFPETFPRLLERWVGQGLLDMSDGLPRLTLQGSWFIGNMVLEARGIAEQALEPALQARHTA